MVNHTVTTLIVEIRIMSKAPASASLPPNAVKHKNTIFSAMTAMTITNPIACRALYKQFPSNLRLYEADFGTLEVKI